MNHCLTLRPSVLYIGCIGTTTKYWGQAVNSDHFFSGLGELQPLVDRALTDMAEERVLARIWGRDHTVWQPQPKEISNRLGWLKSPEVMARHLNEIRNFTDRCRDMGLTRVLLMGMGGSSLAPEVMARIFGSRDGYPELTVLDSTDPRAVARADEKHDPETTLHLVCSKSGGTVEPLSLFKHFYNRVLDTLGPELVGTRFAAITDPGSGLADMARRLDFTKVFLNDPDIGGRYSALSFFGLVPAGLIGLDLGRLLASARDMAGDSAAAVSAGTSLGLKLGAVLGQAALSGRDKLTVVFSPLLEPMGDWVEQLIAESTGKQGKGILPVVGEPMVEPGHYGDDRLFVYTRLTGDEAYDQPVSDLELSGQPVVRLQVESLYDLGGLFFLWEMACVVAGRQLGINPFDQPNVEAAKILAREMVTAYQQQQTLPDQKARFEANGLTFYGDVEGDDPASAWTAFLDQAGPGAYVAVQAYVPPDEGTDRALARLREALLRCCKTATTAGYGPRYLHSTGQLHKGDAGHGLFIQITSESEPDVAIPDQAGSAASSISFQVLKMAQALGDGEALVKGGRKMVRIHTCGSPARAMDHLTRLTGQI